MEHPKGAAVDGIGVLEGFLHVGVFPVGATQKATGVGEGWKVFSITFECGTDIVVEVGMGNDKVSNVLRTNAFLEELI